MSNQIVKEGYNKITDQYLKYRTAFKSEKYLEIFSKLVPKGRTILDVGCGAGIPVDSYLTSKGFAVNGIDISEKQIELAKKNVPEAFYEVRDMEDLKYEEYCVDAIVSFYAIFHIPRDKHEELFKKFASFMPNGGVILVTMGTSDSEGIENFFDTQMYWSQYSLEKNREIIKNAGFEIILDEIDTSGGEKHQVIIAKKK